MRIPKRPRELSTTLAEHAKLEDPPVFFYRFPTPREHAALLERAVRRFQLDPEVRERLRGLSVEEQAAELDRAIEAREGVQISGTHAEMLADLFDEQLVRIENFDIEDEPFDRAKHLEDVPGPWKLAVGREIQQRIKSYLTELEVGNSPSPSASATTPSTGDAAATSAEQDLRRP